MMEKIFCDGELVGLTAKISAMGAESLTDKEAPLQVLLHKRLRGDLVKPHRHHHSRRETQILNECLIIWRGRIRVNFFQADGAVGASREIGAGELIIMTGRHSVEMLEDVEMAEIKNGPFVDDREDVRSD